MPAGGSLVVKQGAVDYAGSAGLTSNVRNIARFTAAQIASHGGSETITVDTTAESYLRTVVLDANGTTIAAAKPGVAAAERPARRHSSATSGALLGSGEGGERAVPPSLAQHVHQHACRASQRRDVFG